MSSTRFAATQRGAVSPIVISIQVGLPQTLGDPGTDDPNRRQWRTGFFKSPVQGPVQVRRLNLEGDGQADLRVHGGPDKAILAYSADHYPIWKELLAQPEMPYGAFGENLTIASLSEESVCIGDLWRIGEGQLQVSQPRQPCWKLARRWERPDLPKLVVKTGHSGWYFRVLTEGVIQAGIPCELLERPHPEWTIAAASRQLYDHSADVNAGHALAALPELSESWRDDLLGRLYSRRG